jgi:hypothetical protein
VLNCLFHNDLFFSQWLILCVRDCRDLKEAKKPPGDVSLPDPDLSGDAKF